jgi:hypothetical protein
MQSKENLTTLCGLSGEETELDFSGQDLGDGDAVLITNDISDMGALSTLIFGGDKVNSRDKAAPEPATLKVGMTEADFSSKKLGPAGAIIISAWISHTDKGAMTSLNLSKNDIGGYWDDQKGEQVATPEGTLVATVSPTVAHTLCIS